MSISNLKKPGKPLHNLLHTVEAMDALFFKLFDLMEKQIEAVISSDTERVQKLAEEHSVLQQRYKKAEKFFVDELENCLSPIENEGPAIKLESLKKIYPAEISWIDQVKEIFTEHTSSLVTKHKQLMDLLEFALVQNANVMHALYNSHSEKHMHYSSTGNKTGIQSGVAINQEI